VATSHDGLNAPTENRLLAALPKNEYDRLLAQTQDVSVGVRDVLYRANGPIEFVYFPRSGVMSMVVVMDDGGSVEVGMVGNEGLVGVPAFLGTDRSPTQVFCQVGGEMRRMRANVFRAEVRKDGPLQLLVMRYTQALLNTVSQATACNQLHAVEKRCARWLLATHDRVGADEFPLTQEFLAMMLGVRRASVTEAAGALQKAKLVTYHRGRIQILNRKKLEAASCECYRLIRDQLDRLLPAPGWADS
jgi:CRP-like cAMP-binding protein